ncbi:MULTISPECIES: TIGR02147 family protein [unclassified Fibrobacter]|uniref:TIGR02147 family protein n=1 Tax=unclassified Fibrobacter TaxID=2634177 RepID=UPI000919FAD5|nr:MULTISPECIES: TIGR02147 family protein [unclassified Fibrobacter]SHK23163.1 TIGR02147 family protein [Fibrobacter sp. UWB12]SIO13518.1 TIGR02147 family protein [Fibrobacter sp. UWB11]
MLKSVIEYQNYHQYIQDYYSEKKSSSAFTWREFAKLAGFASGSYLKLVSDNKAKLVEEGAQKTALAMGLQGFEYDYFMLLVQYENAKNDQQKKKFFEEIQELSSAHNVKLLGSESYTYYESWLHSVVRELAPAMPGSKPLEIAKAIRIPVTAAEISESLHFLVKNNFLKMDENGNYHQTDKLLTTGRLGFVSVPVHSLIRKMGEFALQAFEDLPISERHFSGLTMGMTEKSYNEVIETLKECRKKIFAIVSAEEDVEKICRLNVQLFPLTKNIKKRSKEDTSNSEV